MLCVDQRSLLGLTGTELPQAEQDSAAQAAVQRRFVQRKPKVAPEQVNEEALSGVFGSVQRKKAKTNN